MAPSASAQSSASSAPAAGASAPFTIADILSAPFPSSLVAAPVGGAVAWASDSMGVRNIYVARPPAYRGSRVTSYTRDDGQEITDLQWLAEARGLVYVRGDGPNGKGEIPNPSLLPGGTDQSVWVVMLDPTFRPIAGPRKLGEGHAPAAAPNSGRIAFVDKDQIWSGAAGGQTPAAQILHTRGKVSTLRWSPDGTRLAFVSDRTTHAFVGVYNVSSNTLVYLAPSVDRDGFPAWAPDSRQIAFVRQPARTRVAVFGARRSEQPWSIWTADPATGLGQERWRAGDGAGSVFHELDPDVSGVGEGDDPGQQLFWGADGRLVFPWERDGWQHLYAIPAGGAEPTLLTPGAFEVEQAVGTPDRSALIVTSNQGDLERRRLWRVATAGSAASVTPVAEGVTDPVKDGIQWSPTPLPDGKGIALFHAGTRVPARPALVTSGSAPRDIAPELLPARLPSGSLVDPQLVTFAAADGLELH